MTEPSQVSFKWEPQPAAAQWLNRFVDDCVSNCDFVATLKIDMKSKTGTRLVDWIDHVVVPNAFIEDLLEIGYESRSENVMVHQRGLFPKVCFGERAGIAIKVETVEAFIGAHDLRKRILVQGEGNTRFRTASLVFDELDFVAVERHGYQGFQYQSGEDATWPMDVVTSFVLRSRHDADEQADFERSKRRFVEVESEIGRDRACDLFFAAERTYWMSRNHAARLQKARQDQLGLGWANHDHHTYRCSREHFSRLIDIFERMGFYCRERFYAGREAGWGAQVLEHAECGITIFADVDLEPEEVSGDFAHEGLKPRKKLGTVGLWCKLHGDSFLAAGLHHLECQFDFDASRQQLADFGVETMAPFTDFPFLRQAFTKGEKWEIDKRRLDRLIAEGSISKAQYDQFLANGAIGSHLEILERNDGYKGFNQTGISDIIHKTDPRRVSI